MKTKKNEIELTVDERRQMYIDAMSAVHRIDNIGGHGFVCNILDSFLRKQYGYNVDYSLAKLFPELFMFKRKNVSNVWLAVALSSTTTEDNCLRMTVLSLCIEMCGK